jgi:hypothetical protein
VDSAGEGMGFRCWCGEDEAVVMEVFAVRGRSAVACDTTAPEVAGIFPPNSMRRILVFSSSSSSQTEVAGPVDP